VALISEAEVSHHALYQLIVPLIVTLQKLYPQWDFAFHEATVKDDTNPNNPYGSGRLDCIIRGSEKGVESGKRQSFKTIALTEFKAPYTIDLDEWQVGFAKQGSLRYRSKTYTDSLQLSKYCHACDSPYIQLTDLRTSLAFRLNARPSTLKQLSTGKATAKVDVKEITEGESVLSAET
jgi:hypothetical protein